ncbi:M20/M25/M40 family metallo-hydrolase [Antarcticibacterium flavum]|uniref:M20/M25/M40 family metallo-hydrolase n=1 Tax=Antarcticibacterium flavum TaxID=2058175 RepID=A0A5B7X265_9FLAO|nr:MULTISPECIES: M20 family metallo-hydrolase [Antarcticibacterium]MCM4160231.1 acetylornithine deacetylase [Antarcticibacterium sp. W02-3]QCY68693.1 M20/M25/M40 family metallo-hydrolase [Antarcticibacterium flavum]
MELHQLQKEAIELLKKLIETPSFSREEEHTAVLLENWLRNHQIPFERHLNNIWVVNKYFDESKPTLLLNSHHDTVKPNSAYTNDPFEAMVEEGKLFGLGSNDAGGCLVSLLATFTYFYEAEGLEYNLLFAGTAEEEINGANGIACLLPKIPKIDVAIVGEPTLMKLAIAEKGLIVFDAVVRGTPSHAAHPNDDNAIYKTAKVLEWFENFSFDKTSEVLGPVKLTVTQIQAGSQHNVVPANVDLVIDVRVNDRYSNAEIEKILQEKAPVDEIKARSLRLNSSSIAQDHPLVEAGVALGMETYGSPTLSDQAMLSCPSLKLGPGDSTRSHSANEFIYIKEIEEGIAGYIKLLEKALQKQK